MRGRRRDLSLAVAGLVAIAALIWLVGAAETLAALANVEPLRLMLYVLLASAVVVGVVVRWGGIAAALGAPTAPGRLAAARLAGDAVGALVPSARLAGDPLRVAWLVRAHVDSARAGASVALDRATEVAGNTVCAIVYVSIASFALAGVSMRGSTGLILALLGGSLVLIAAPFAMLYRGVRPFGPLYGVGWIRARPRLARWVAALHRSEGQAMSLVRQRPVVLVAALLGTLLIELLIVAEYHVLLGAFGIATDLPTLLLVLLGTGVARAVPTPGALGSLEATQAAVFAAATGDPARGLAAGVVLRLHETLWLAIGLAALFLWRRQTAAPVLGEAARDATSVP